MFFGAKGNARSTVSKAIDQTEDQAKIILFLQPEVWVHKGCALVICTGANREWPLYYTLGGSAHGIGKTSFIPTEVGGGADWNRAAHPGHAGQGVEEDSGLLV